MPVLRILPDDERVMNKPGETILTTLVASGYSHRVGCRRGGCGVCKVDLREGSVHYADVISTDVLSPEEIAAGACLTCRAIPDTDVTIELRDERLKLTSELLRGLRAVSPSTTKE